MQDIRRFLEDVMPGFLMYQIRDINTTAQAQDLWYRMQEDVIKNLPTKCACHHALIQKAFQVCFDWWWEDTKEIYDVV